jgi:hypothetical protein
MTLGRAVAITINTYLRHERSRYDKLLASGFERDEARGRVEEKISRTKKKWAAQSDQRLQEPIS